MRAPNLKIPLLIATIFLTFQASSLFNEIIPETGSGLAFMPVKDELSIIDPDSYNNAKLASHVEKNSLPSNGLTDFVGLVVDGKSDSIRGVYSENEFAYPVVQQPSGNPGYVSPRNDVVTEFTLAKKYGVTGIIAHNYLAGREFFQLEIGEVIQIVYGDGEILSYKIASIQRYQALSPNSASSQFVDLATTEVISASQLFKRVYMGDQHLTLQTCINQDYEDSWGRLFILAEPI
jgi:hypothetical protein